MHYDPIMCMMIPDKGTKTIRTMDASTSLLDPIKKKESELKKLTKKYIQELKAIKDKKEFETKKRKYYLDIKYEGTKWHDTFNKEANLAMSAASKLEEIYYPLESIEFNG